MERPMNQICQRCHKPTATTIMSMFNMDMICPQCKEDERKHPMYELAAQKEREAVLQGVRNFPGMCSFHCRLKNVTKESPHDT